MTPQRRDSLLSGQPTIVQKVYQCIPDDSGKFATTLDVASALTKLTGSGMDIKTLRGCLSVLAKTGLVREIVRGSFRREPVKEKKDVTTIKTTAAPAPAVQPDIARMPVAGPLEALGGIASRVRDVMAQLGKIANEIDEAAIAMEERGVAHQAELDKFKQLKSLLKELG